MKMIIAASYGDVHYIKNLFSQLTPLKGYLPMIKSAHDLVNEYKYEIDEAKKSGGITPNYPQNILKKMKDLYDEYDIIIVPTDSILLSALFKEKKFKNIFIYEKDNSIYNLRDMYEGYEYMLEEMDRYENR